VFICYKRLSAQDFAETLKKSLEESGVHAFLDTKDIPNKFRGTEEWTKARDKAVIESKTFVFIITAGFDLSPEIKKELSLARKYANKEFVYFRHESLPPNLKIVLDTEELDLGKQNQVSFITTNDLVRKAYNILIDGQDVSTLSNEFRKTHNKKIIAAISNFVAFYGTEFGSKKVWKVYPKLFKREETKSIGKADQIWRVLETYVGNKAQFKQALQRIINLHKEYSLKNISALREIITDLGFIVGDDLSLGGAEKPIKRAVKKPDYDFGQFDESFRALEQATQPKTKAIMLEYFQPKLRKLCYDYDWNDEVKDRILKVLNYIPKSLADDPNVNNYLQYLGMITNRCGKYVMNTIKERFLGELENLYADPRFETNAQLLSLLQELHEFSEQYMMELIEDAGSIADWSDQRFQALCGSIELWELKKDREAHKRVGNYLRIKMDDAERNKDEKTLDRLKKIYNLWHR